MRNWNNTLLTMLSGTEITRCYLARLQNDTGQDVRLTSHDVDIVIGAETFVHAPGFTLSRYTVKNGGTPATLDIAVPFTETGPIYVDHVRRGAWRGGRITVWITDYTNPGVRELIGEGWVGLTEFTDSIQGQLELVTQADKLRDIFLPTLQPKCFYEFTGPYCQVNPAPHTRTGVVTVAGTRRQFTVSIASPDTHNFSKGRLTWTTGANAGAKGWVRNWRPANGLTDMVVDFPFDVQVGDQFSILSGCEQNREACSFYNNLVRYPGFDFVRAG